MIELTRVGTFGAYPCLGTASSSGRRSARLAVTPPGVHRGGTDDPIKRAVLIAVPMQAPDEVAAVLVAEGARYVLWGHLEDVD